MHGPLIELLRNTMSGRNVVDKLFAGLLRYAGGGKVIDMAHCRLCSIRRS